MSSTNLRAAVTGQPPAESKNPVAAFSRFMDNFKPQIALALPKHLNADRMTRLALTEFSKSEKLQQCDPKSIVASIITSSQLGLEIGVNGQGFLVPYGRTATFVPGWKGLVDLANRSGRSSVWTGAVFQGDEFDYQLGDSPFVHHRPGDEDDPKRLTHVYSIGRVNGSNWPVIEVWTMSKVWKHRDQYNKVGTKHYSYRDPEMYARKVPLLQVLKYMPMSIELSNAIAVSNAAEAGQSAAIHGDWVTVGDIDMETGEITAAQPQQSQRPTTQSRPTARVESEDDGPQSEWEPTDEELAEIKQREMAEASRDTSAQSAAPASRRTRGAQQSIE